MLPAQAPNPQERGRPARRTNLAPRLREVLDIVLLMLLVRRRVRGRLSRHAQTARGTRYLCLQGTAVPRSPAPPSGSPALSSPCGQCFFATFQLLAVVRIPTTAQGSRKGHVLLHPKRSFPSCLQTLHTCSADCQQAEDRGRVSKKPVNPNVSTLTGSNKITLIPLQTFQRLRQSSHWTFQVFFRHAQAGSRGFFPGCFFDEPGDKLCLLHLLPLSWPTKDSPFDSMCRLFFSSSLPGAVLYGGSTSLPTLVPRFLGKWPGRRHANPHRPAGPLSIVPTVGSIDESAPYTFFMRPQCNLVRFFSDDF